MYGSGNVTALIKYCVLEKQISFNKKSENWFSLLSFLHKFHRNDWGEGERGMECYLLSN